MTHGAPCPALPINPERSAVPTTSAGRHETNFEFDFLVLGRKAGEWKLAVLLSIESCLLLTLEI